MSFKPREYQSKQIEEVMELLPVKQKILLQLPLCSFYVKTLAVQSC